MGCEKASEWIFMILKSWAWCHTHVISTLQRLRQEDCEFKANLGNTGSFRLTLGYIVRILFQKQSRTKTKTKTQQQRKTKFLHSFGKKVLEPFVLRYQ
jgi:hypothetical protein